MDKRLACEGCGTETAAEEIFYLRDSPLCPACRMKYTGADPEREKKINDMLDKEDARRKRWRESVKKPMRVTVKDPDKDGASRVLIGGRMGFTVVALLIIGYIFYKVGPAALLASLASFDFNGDGVIGCLCLLVCIVVNLLVRTTLTVNDKELQVKTTPIPLWVWNRRVPIEEIRDLELEEYHMGSSTSSSRKTVYRLNLITESGDRHRVVAAQGKKGTYFIEKTVKAMLANRNERFPEMWKAGLSKGKS